MSARKGVRLAIESLALSILFFWVHTAHRVLVSARIRAGGDEPATARIEQAMTILSWHVALALAALVLAVAGLRRGEGWVAAVSLGVALLGLGLVVFVL